MTIAWLLAARSTDGHLELAAVRRLYEHKHNLVGLLLLDLRLNFSLPSGLCSQQISLERDQILLRQISKLLVVIKLLEVVEHLFDLASMLLEMTTSLSCLSVGIFESVDLLLQLLQLGSLLIVEAVKR